MELAVAEQRLQDAIDIVFDPAVVQVPLADVTSQLQPDNCRMAATILNVKVLKPSSRKAIVRWTTHSSPVQYHRLILCRDLSSDGTFYVLSEDPDTTRTLFSFNEDVAYMGAHVVIYEPTADGSTIYDVPIINAPNPFVPATPQTDMAVASAIRRDLHKKGTVHSFLVEINDLRLTGAAAVPACGATFCDGRHATKIPCPGHGCSARTAARTLRLRVSSEEHQLRNVEIRSTRLAQFFMTPDLLKRDNITYRRLGSCVSEAMATYTASGTRWMCHGFYKQQQMDEEQAGAGATGRAPLKVYLCRLEPRGAPPPNLRLYDGVEAAAPCIAMPMIPAVARQGATIVPALPVAMPLADIPAAP